MTIECRIPISPTPSFLNQVLLLASSLRRFHPDAIVRVYIGQAGGATPEAVRLVNDAFAGHRIGFEWIGQREFDAWEGTRSPYLATMNRRFRLPVDGDHVLIMDADTIVTGPFDELFAVEAVQGVMAHVAPLDNYSWGYLFEIAGCAPPEFRFPLSGGGIMGPEGKLSPWYANSGMIWAPKHLFERLCQPYQEAINVISSAMSDTYWADQLAVALAVAKADVPVRSLVQRFNFPNQPAFDEAKPEELRDVRVLHYLREDRINRTRDFESVAALRQLVQRSDFTGSHEILRWAIAANLSILEPPPLGSPGTEPPWA